MNLRNAAVLLGFAAARCAAAGSPSVLPLTEVDGLPRLRCAFEGLPAKCLWDSGAARTRVPNLAPISGYPVLFQENGADMVSVESLSFEGAELGPAVVWRGDIDGSRLGADLLIESRFEVAPAPKPALVLDPKISTSTVEQTVYLDPRNRIVIEINLGSRAVRALWNTGAARTLVSRAAVAAAAPKEFVKIGTNHLSDKTGERYLLDALAIGGVELKDVEVVESAFQDRDAEVILGWDVIRRLRWRFDLTKKVWSVSKP